MDRHNKKMSAMLCRMAHEDPNHTIKLMYESGIDLDDLRDLAYIVQIARRAPGYKPEEDQLLANGIV